MKKLQTIVLLLFTISFYGQWVQQNSGTSENLNDVYCISENIVVVVGDNGTILKTIDGGANWVQKISNTTYNIKKLQFVNQNVGYALGSDSTLNFGNILKTINGGESWTVIRTFNLSNTSDLSCVNENIFCYTNNHILYKSIDGGDTFQTINTTDFIQNIQFINEQVGYALGSAGLVKTIDGGITWNFVRNNVTIFYFLNENVGFFRTGAGLSKTTDGGISIINLTTVDHTMQKIFPPNESIIWGVTGELLLDGQPKYTTRVEVLNTEDFQRIDASIPILKSIHFTNPTKGYGVAWGGEIYKNTTGTMLGLNGINSEKSIKIYPNPTSDQITIAFSEQPASVFSIEILDSLGKGVFHKVYNLENNIIINTKPLSKGVYFLTVAKQEKRQTQKLIIN